MQPMQTNTMTRRIDLTRSRPNYSAIKGGKIRPNPLAFLAVGKKNDVHERDFIASANGRQTKTARPARKSFGYVPGAGKTQASSMFICLGRRVTQSSTLVTLAICATACNN